MTEPASPWGSNAAGLSWELTGTAYFSGGPGRITLSPGAEGVALMPPSIRNVEAAVLASVDQAASGGWIVPSVRLRVNGDTYLAVNLEFKETGRYGVAAYEIVDGVASWLGGEELGDYTAGHQYRLRLQALDDVIQAKVWDTEVAEYEHWQITYHTANITSAGQVGIAAYAEAANTNTSPVVTFRGFEVPNPQAFLVERSANNITKAHSAGTSVRLTDPLVLSL